MEIQAFLSLMGHYRQFIKGFMCIVWPLNRIFSGEGASRKSERVLLPEDALRAFDALKQACMSAPVLTFADYTKEFLLETNASKGDWGKYYPKNRQMGNTTHLPMVVKPLQLIKNYHSTKLEFLAQKWVITDHFKEYLPYQPFLVRTDSNPLTYIMTTPNLDATGHQWVQALVRFNFQLEYQKGWDNTVEDMLSQITTCLSPEAVWSILDWVSLGATHRVEGYDPAVVEATMAEKKKYVSPQGGCWLRCMWLIVPKQKERSCVGLAGSLKEDWSEDTLGRACL